MKDRQRPPLLPSSSEKGSTTRYARLIIRLEHQCDERTPRPDKSLRGVKVATNVPGKMAVRNSATGQSGRIHGG
jgi:hypothetical protein